MKLSTKCRYGLRAAIEIARLYGSGPAKRRDIAASQGVSDSYLENILILLKNKRIIETTRGANGGYVLSRSPSTVTVLDIVNALEGPLELIECIGKPDACEKSPRCVSRGVWDGLVRLWQEHLSGYTLADLLDMEAQKQNSNYTI